MSIKNDSIYISGLVNMASYNLSPSYMETDCMELKNYIETFARYYEIPPELIKLKKINIEIDKFFENLLKIDKKSTDNLIYWITKTAGDCHKIYRVENKEFFDYLSDNNKNLTPFFFLEEIYFIEFENMAICFMIGNDE